MIMYEPALPIVFPEKQRAKEGTVLLAVDIGGTKTDLALYTIHDASFELLQEKKYESQHWDSFTAILRHFMEWTAVVPHRISIAAAGPVRDGKVKLTNLKWALDVTEIQQDLDVEQVFLINDLEAQAYGLAMLSPEELISIYPGNSHSEGNAAIIAPGTGLGEGGLFWDGETFHPFATEGGHTDFSPRTEQDIRLLLYLQAQFGAHVSWERIISGPGIYNIYQFLREVEKREEPEALQKLMSESDDPSHVIGVHADQFAICKETITLFLKYLAIEASNLALKLKATGGLFIGGGIPPKLWKPAYQDIFLEHFFQVGRLRPLIEAVPVKLVLNVRTPVLGAVYYGLYQ